MDAILKHFNDAVSGKTKPEREAAASAFAAGVAKTGVALSFHELKINELLTTNFTKEGKKGATQREGAARVVGELVKASSDAAPLLLPVTQLLFEVQGDKAKPAAEAAAESSKALWAGVDENLLKVALPELLKPVLSKEGNLDRFLKIRKLCKSAPFQVSMYLQDLIPNAIGFMKDLNKKVAKSAQKTLGALCDTCTNPDMEPFLPALVQCMIDLDQVPETVFKMSSTVFVAEVDAACLSILAPVLSKGLNTTSKTDVKRSCARIIENMSKLVDEPRYLTSFLPKILPLLDSAKENVSDPEAREVCGKASEMLARKAQGAAQLKFDLPAAKASLAKLLDAAAPSKARKDEMKVAVEFAAQQASMLNEVNEMSSKEWTKSLTKTLVNLMGLEAAKAATVIESLRAEAEASREVVAEEEIDDGAEVLCDLPFGLAYGNKVLMRKTRLKLLRGHKYGLLGQNDSGKTSLLNALADYKIDGFPSADELRTVFVATDIKTELADLTVLEYMYEDPLLKECGASKEDMAKLLESMGFREGAPANTTQRVGTLSGGWRMKLALSRAMLLKADILLLDEPTNHLDAYNVKWVETYLQSLTHVTAIMVSHDSGLLTRVCNNIIEIHEMKLRYYRGNLEEFLKSNPEAKCYFELAEKGKIDFHFPKPGPLPGITSKGKAILRMTNITFTYPEPDGSYTLANGEKKKPQLNNVTVQVSLSSRVACVGENGAGKSTMIKLLTGELEPDKGSGEVWKHPNCRVGYIAQHAFHHIEKHLDETANDYIRWRYANGGDREATVKITSICTAEDIKKMEAKFECPFPQEDGSVVKRKVTVDRLTERRRDNKKDKTVEYEVVFKEFSGNHYVERDLLCKNGWEKMLKNLDEKIALRATQFARPQTKENVQKHLADVGLAAEFSTHLRMKSLSGGQKVKVVLASALWTQPHILILDEPTNYLDRESLGALARAIRSFEGGVVMITHNSQFCDNLCPVVWHLQNNTLDVKGDAEWMAEAARQKIVVDVVDESDMVDRFGNTVELVKKKKYTKKELKQKKLRRLKRFKETGDDYDSDEDDI
jgi:elongation factor 3